ncbi:MAG: hypothetical protein ACRER5_10040, partial [Pseudomonas sp.]
MLLTAGITDHQFTGVTLPRRDGKMIDTDRTGRQPVLNIREGKRGLAVTFRQLSQTGGIHIQGIEFQRPLP